MGTWSHEPFGNDTAGDWSIKLVKHNDLSYLESTLDIVLLHNSPELQCWEEEEAIAAVEVLAKLLGKGTQRDVYTEDVDSWIATLATRPSPALLQKAKEVIRRILTGASELRSSWEAAAHCDAWKASLACLESTMDAR